MPQRLPSLNALRAFEAAGRHLSFTKAAEELHVTPAAVGHQIKVLEENLGVALFRRLTRAVVLTDAGQSILPGIRDGFTAFGNALERLRGQEKGGVLNLAVSPGLSAKWLVPRLSRFHIAYPDIDIHMFSSTRIIDFARDAVDLSIRFGKGDYPGLHVELLLREELFPVCSPKLLEGPNPLRTPDDLRNHTLIQDDTYKSFEQHRYPGLSETFQDFPDWRTWLNAAGVHDIDPFRGPAVSPTIALIQAAVDGRGVALARGVLVASDLADGRLVKPFDLTIPLDVAQYLVCPETAAERPKVAAFREWVLGEARKSQAHIQSTAR